MYIDIAFACVKIVLLLGKKHLTYLQSRV